MVKFSFSIKANSILYCLKIMLLSNMMLYDVIYCLKQIALTLEKRRKNCPKPTVKTPEQRQIAEF